MCNCKKYFFCAMFTLFFTLLSVHYLQATEPAARENTEGKGKNAPSLTMQGTNIDIVPVKSESDQTEKGSKGKNSTEGAQPQIAIESPSFDAGEVWEGEDIAHAFTVTNTGKAELQIINVKAG